jgi:hypothetical protein
MTGGHGSNRDDGASAFLFDKMEPERQFLVRSLPPRDARVTGTARTAGSGAGFSQSTGERHCSVTPEKSSDVRLWVISRSTE